MKTVTIRELHARTGQLVREALRHGEIRVTDNGRPIARIVPEAQPAEAPYFARRKMSPAFKRLRESGKLGLGTDSTIAISEDREDRV
ncbi:MAG: type II toxin-antitoxin system Phd/YefM family antitoxin [Limisphaerales bacterium]